MKTTYNRKTYIEPRLREMHTGLQGTFLLNTYMYLYMYMYDMLILQLLCAKTCIVMSVLQ